MPIRSRPPRPSSPTLLNVNGLTPERLLAELRARGALLDGHVRLSSGRHSPGFVQKFRLLEDPEFLERVVAAMLAGIPDRAIGVVVSAAVGGIVLGYECARQLGTRAIFVEKEAGTATFRRGFFVAPGERVLVVEDVITTGLSVREVIDVVEAQGGDVVQSAVLVRRSPVDVGVPLHALLDLPIESFDPGACAQCAAGVPLSEPGSRFLR
jgi:orotate phosphoribosyltransferase